MKGEPLPYQLKQKIENTLKYNKMDIWHYICKNEIDEDCPFMPGFKYIVRKAEGDLESTHVSIDGVFMEHYDNMRRSVKNISKQVCARYLIFYKKVC